MIRCSKRVRIYAMKKLKRILVSLVCLAVASCLWLNGLRVYYRPAEASVRPSHGMSPRANALLSRQLALWNDPSIGNRETARMRASNPEWDFMGRTYLVLALANVALRDASQAPRYLAVMDRLIDDTLQHERDHGMYYFLMSYARAQPWVFQPERSVFVDGEIAMMMAARRVVRDDGRYRTELRERAERIQQQMQASTVGSAESYPNECWTFCNTLALAALRTHDALDGTNHVPLARTWLAFAKRRLIDERTGMLVSSYTLDGQVRDGPEGSTIYMAAHDLLLVDPSFARDQYARARRWLGREVVGFGYAREWPDARAGREDVDSGPTVPWVGANAGASGMALLGAGAFRDNATLAGLVASLDFAAFPVSDATGLRYEASNPVGDAVLLYSLVEGPLWDVITQRLQP
jgi:hypothetical protein